MSEKKEEKIGQMILKRLWADDMGKDLTFNVEMKTVRCHRFIVRESSEYFRKLLQSESNFVEGSKHEIPMEDISHDIFSSVIQYFYTDEICIDNSNVWDLLKAAERFLIESLNKICSEFLQATLSPDSCWELLTFTRTYKWKEEFNKPIALRFISRNPAKCKLQESKEVFSMTEWKLMIQTANSEGAYSRGDNDILIGIFVKNIQNSVCRSQEWQICGILKEAIPRFEDFVTVDNALLLFSLSQKYQCEELRRLAVRSLAHIASSKQLLCSTSKNTFDSLIDYLCNYSSGTEYARECGNVILAWLNKNVTSLDHVETLFSKYSHILGKTLSVENVMEIFRQARLCGSSKAEMECSLFIDKNARSFIDDLAGTSAAEMKSISNAHLQNERRCDDFYTNHHKKSSYNLKVQSFLQLVKENSVTGETVFPSLKSFLEKYDSKIVITAKKPIEAKKEREKYKAKGETETWTRKFFGYKRKLSNEEKYFKRERETDREAFGEALEMWLMLRKGSECKAADSCINTLLSAHYIEIGYNLSSENIEAMYSLALSRHQQEFEALCFCYVIEHFQDSIGLILRLPFPYFSSFIILVSKLYKEDIRVHLLLGQITTCWMSAISKDFNKYAEIKLGFKDFNKLPTRENVTENMVIEKLGFLIRDMLTKIDLKSGLLISLRISAKLRDKRNEENHQRILDCCVQNYSRIIKENEFVTLYPDELSKIISRGREMNEKSRLYFRWGVSETDIMQSIIHWYTSGKASDSQTPRTLHLERNENDNDRRKSFVTLFRLLQMDEVPILELLDVVERFHFLLDVECLRTKFFIICRDQLKRK